MNKNRFLCELSESPRTDFGKVDFAEQSEEQKTFSAIWILEAEVNNGGFLQYFGNDRGETVGVTPIALRRIGANRCADIVERAIHVVSDGIIPSDPEQAETLIAAVSDEACDAINVLDQEFFTYPDNLTELLYAFVSRHPSVFGPVSAD